MEFKLSKNEMNDLLKECIVFRNEELSRLTSEDKRHLLKFDDFEKRLFRNLLYKNRKFAKNEFEKMYEHFLDFSSYYNEKYYRSGFGYYEFRGVINEFEEVWCYFEEVFEGE